MSFLQEVLPELIDNVPLETSRNIWFLHDGDQHISDIILVQWNGCGDPVPSPARFPDLRPIDF